MIPSGVTDNSEPSEMRVGVNSNKLKASARSGSDPRNVLIALETDCIGAASLNEANTIPINAGRASRTDSLPPPLSNGGNNPKANRTVTPAGSITNRGMSGSSFNNLS